MIVFALVVISTGGTTAYGYTNYGPQGIRCGAENTENGLLADIGVTTSEAQCAVDCDAAPTCLAISFNTETSECILCDELCVASTGECTDPDDGVQTSDADWHMTIDQSRSGTFVCNEDGSTNECHCVGEVRYGAGSQWTDWIDVTDFVICSAGTWDGVDPAPGVAKKCECRGPPTPYPTPIPTAPTPVPTTGNASSGGDPHIKQIDGTKFDIDAVGSYDLLRVPFDSGKDFKLKSTVGKEHPEATSMYNRAAEFSGSWVGGHNLTLVGAQGGHGAGIYIDGALQLFNVLCKGGPYQRALSTNAEIHAEICQAEGSSDFCKSQRKWTPSKKRKAAYQPSTAFVSITTPQFIVVVHSYLHHGNLDIHVDTKAGAALENVGGLLMPTTRKSVFMPLHASSIGDKSDLTLAE